MGFLYSLDAAIFNLLAGNADTPTIWVVFAVVCAKALIYFIPLHMLILWFYGGVDDRRTVVTIVLSIVVCLIVSAILGHAFYRPRPFVAGLSIGLMDHKNNASFPSDHAVIFAAYVSCLLMMRYKFPAYIGFVLAAFTCWARIFVGVHYPFDILGGIVIGIVVAKLAVPLVPRLTPEIMVTFPPIRNK